MKFIPRSFYHFRNNNTSLEFIYHNKKVLYINEYCYNREYSHNFCVASSRIPYSDLFTDAIIKSFNAKRF